MRRTCDRDLHDLVIYRWIGDLDDKLFGDALPSTGGVYSLKIEFLMGEYDCAPFVVCCYVKDRLEKDVLFLLHVRLTQLMCFPPAGLDVAVTKPTMKTSGWGFSLLRLDLWCDTSILREFQMLLTSNVRIPRASGKVLVTGGTKYVD